MLRKTFLNNIKNRPIQYIIILLCQLLLFAIVLSASGIMLDGLSKEEGQNSYARYYEFKFRNLVHTSELYDKLEYFFSECPYNIRCANIRVASDRYDFEPNANYDENGFYTHPDYLYFYPSYQDLQRFMENLDTPPEVIPSEQQFNEHQRVVILGNDTFGFVNGEPVRFQYTDDNHIIIEGEEYLVLGSHEGYYTIMLWGKEQKTLMTKYISFSTEDILTDIKINEVTELFLDIFGGETAVVPQRIPEFQTLLDVRQNAANIIISLLLIILTVFNIILIYDQMVICRKHEFAVLCFCGFKKKTCIMYCLAELLILTVFSSVAACIIFDIVIKPFLNEFYSAGSLMFTPGYYIIFVFGYIVFSVLMFLAVVASTLKKSVCAQLYDM